MSDYWWGVVTVPMALVGLAVVAGLALIASLVIERSLARFGLSISARWTRQVNEISSYTLRHDIWWERSFGPVFLGGWYHERPTMERRTTARANRWIGIGRVTGPSLTAFVKRELGEVVYSDAVPTAAEREAGDDERSVA